MTTSLASHPLLIPPDLAKEIGLHEAVILQQMHYWLERSTHLINGCHWIYNTYQAWQQQFPFLSLAAIRKAIARLEGLNLLKTERFDKQRWNQTKWYSINYQRLEVLICRICSEQPHRAAQFEQLDVTDLSSSSTENIAITTSKNTPPQSEERKEEKSDKAVVAKSCTSLSTEDELVSDEQIDFDRDLRSAPANRIQNDFDGLPCQDTPATKSDSSAFVQSTLTKQTNYLPQRAPTTKPSKYQSDRIHDAATHLPVLESPTRTQLLIKLSALTNESLDSLRLNTIFNSALDRYPNRATDALEYFQQAIATW